MAIIYTYPLASTPVDANDLVIITDVSDNNKSKNTTIQSIIDLAGTGGGTGLDGEFAFFDGNGTTIKGSDLLTTSNNRVFIKDYISHKDNSTGDTAFFGFNNDNQEWEKDVFEYVLVLDNNTYKTSIVHISINQVCLELLLI